MAAAALIIVSAVPSAFRAYCSECLLLADRRNGLGGRVQVAKAGMLSADQIMEGPIALELQEHCTQPRLEAVLNCSRGGIADGHPLTLGTQAPVHILVGCYGEVLIEVHRHMGQGDAEVAGAAVHDSPICKPSAVQGAYGIMEQACATTVV